jgi:alpha-glucosidase (family GH31 glycosyl hydrolase)
VYYFQSDPTVRALGNQKMIGPDLMMAAITGADIETVSVYLPAGDWFNYHTGEFIESSGEWIDVPTLYYGVRYAPLFVRDGAIIPIMRVGVQTMNTLGQRRDGSTDNTLSLMIYHASEDGQTMVIDDDGATIAYEEGDVWQTTITSTEADAGLTVTVGALETTSDNAPKERPVELYIIESNPSVASVLLNDVELPVSASMETFEANDQGWMFDDKAGVIHVKSGVVDVTQPLTFVFVEQSGD